MCTSIWRRVTLALPLALLAAGWDGDCRVWAQSSESNIGVSKVSGENDASLFDSRLLNTAATSNGACIASPPSGGRCIESPTQAPNLINPDAVFSPDGRWVAYQTGDAVGGIVVMRQGENALSVIERVKQKLSQLKPSLPEGVEVIATYDRSELIDRAIHTVKGKR